MKIRDIAVGGISDKTNSTDFRQRILSLVAEPEKEVSASLAEGIGNLFNNMELLIGMKNVSGDRLGKTQSLLCAAILASYLNSLPPDSGLGNTLTNISGGHVCECDQETGSKSIRDIDMSVRAWHCLEAARIFCVAELLQKSPEDLLKIKSLVRSTLRSIQSALGEKNLHLKGDIVRKKP